MTPRFSADLLSAIAVSNNGRVLQCAWHAYEIVRCSCSSAPCVHFLLLFIFLWPSVLPGKPLSETRAAGGEAQARCVHHPTAQAECVIVCPLSRRRLDLVAPIMGARGLSDTRCPKRRSRMCCPQAFVNECR